MKVVSALVKARKVFGLRFREPLKPCDIFFHALLLYRNWNCARCSEEGDDEKCTRRTEHTAVPAEGSHRYDNWSNQGPVRGVSGIPPLQKAHGMGHPGGGWPTLYLLET